MEEIITVTDLFIYRGEGLDGILERYTEKDNVRLLKIAFRVNQSKEGIELYQIGPVTIKQNRSLFMEQTFELKNGTLIDLIENKEHYNEQIKTKFGDYDFFERGYCTALYLEDLETHYAAEFKLVSQNEKIPTDVYLNRGIRAINPKFLNSFEFTGNLYRLKNDKLKKTDYLELNERTRPQLDRYIPNVCEAVFPKTCNQAKDAVIVTKELTCSFDGQTPTEAKN